MKIQSISNIYNQINYKSFNNMASSKPVNNKSPLTADVISFTSKKYDFESILEPTNHCAYCGCKIYTEAQLDSLAKEMLSSKASRLDGNIKSVLEKLSGAKHSPEIETAKNMENKEEIEFFKKLLDISSKKSYLKGKAIFEQVYNLEEEEAKKLLAKNMHPILATIDHISPQRENNENKHSDINLVEACACCNQKLKGGSSFGEFYTMFPSIKFNMPKEKFNYAYSNLLNSSQEVVSQRLSAVNIIKLLDRLFIQKNEAANYLESVNFRINSCKSEIVDAVAECENNISKKENEISELENKLKELNKDPEYAAMTKRVNLNMQLKSISEIIKSKDKKKQNISGSINNLQNEKKSNNNAETLSKEEKEEKIKQLKLSLALVENQILEQEERQLNIKLQIEKLNTEFPDIETVKTEELNAKEIYNAHLSLKQTKSDIEKETSRIKSLTEEEKELKSQISKISENDINFDPEKYQEEQRAYFSRYKELNEAADFIEKHPNGNNIRLLINNFAKASIITEMSELEKQPIVIDYKNNLRQEELKLQLEQVSKEKKSACAVLERLKQEHKKYESIAKTMTEQEAADKIKICSDTILRLGEKQNYLKIPQRISTLKAEISLLRQTIKDLQSKQSQIEAQDT